VKHLLQVVPKGLRALDGFEQLLAQGHGFTAPAAPCPPPAPDEVKSQQPQKDDAKPHGKPQEQSLSAEQPGREVVVNLHIPFDAF
jgi:hypothetical protein